MSQEQLEAKFVSFMTELEAQIAHPEHYIKGTTVKISEVSRYPHKHFKYNNEPNQPLSIDQRISARLLIVEQLKRYELSLLQSLKADAMLARYQLHTESQEPPNNAL